MGIGVKNVLNLTQRQGMLFTTPHSPNRSNQIVISGSAKSWNEDGQYIQYLQNRIIGSNHNFLTRINNE